MIREIQVITTGPSQDTARDEAGKAFDLVFGKDKWDGVKVEIAAHTNELQDNPNFNPDAENPEDEGFGEPALIPVTVLWQGLFVARPKA